MPVDRGTIDAQLKEIGQGERWWDQREFRDLPHILNADERIAGLVNGRILGRPRPRVLPAAQWLIVATNQRLICLQQQRFGRKQVDIRPSHITGLDHTNKLASYQITLETTQRRYRIRIPKADAFAFLRALGPLMQTPDGQPALAGAPAESRIPGAGVLAALPGLSGLAPKAPHGDFVPRSLFERLEITVERHEKEIERLQEQVAFMEDLLQVRAAEGMLSLPATSASTADATRSQNA